MRLGKRERQALKARQAVNLATMARIVRTGNGIGYRPMASFLRVLPLGKRRGYDWAMLQGPKGGVYK